MAGRSGIDGATAVVDDGPGGTSTTGQPANNTTGSRLPCSAVPASTRAAASMSDVRQSTPTMVAVPGLRASDMAPSSSAVPTPKCVIGTPHSASAAKTLRAVRQYVLTVVGQRQGARPRVEHLDGVYSGVDLTAQERDGRSVSFAISACQLVGSASIIALVRAWLRLGPPSTR